MILFGAMMIVTKWDFNRLMLEFCELLTRKVGIDVTAFYSRYVVLIIVKIVGLVPHVQWDMEIINSKTELISQATRNRKGSRRQKTNGCDRIKSRCVLIRRFKIGISARYMFFNECKVPHLLSEHTTGGDLERYECYECSLNLIESDCSGYLTLYQKGWIGSW